MTERHYYQKEDLEGAFYIFDSKVLSEKEFEEKYDYDGYNVFADSLTGAEILKLLNEHRILKGQKALAQTVIDMKNKKFEKLEKENELLKKEIERLKGRYYDY